MVFHSEIVPGQHFEGLELTVGELNVHVHAAGPDQRRVKFVDVIGGEDDDPLSGARRPDPVDEVEQPGQSHLAILPVAIAVVKY